MAGLVAAPLIRGLTVAASPALVPHDPPMDVTLTLVAHGNTRTEPFTLVTDTTGGVVSTTRALLAPREPVAPGAGRPIVAVLVASSVIVPPLRAAVEA